MITYYFSDKSKDLTYFSIKLQFNLSEPIPIESQSINDIHVMEWDIHAFGDTKETDLMFWYERKCVSIFDSYNSI